MSIMVNIGTKMDNVNIAMIYASRFLKEWIMPTKNTFLE
jgi:hypothetical protein